MPHTRPVDEDVSSTAVCARDVMAITKMRFCLLAGISSDLMHSQEATDDCWRRSIGLCAHAQIRDDGPNMETYHEGTYRSSRVGHADCGPDIRSPGERGSDVPGELFIRL